VIFAKDIITHKSKNLVVRVEKVPTPTPSSSTQKVALDPELQRRKILKKLSIKVKKTTTKIVNVFMKNNHLDVE
jgi:hypothetical protein